MKTGENPTASKMGTSPKEDYLQLKQHDDEVHPLENGGSPRNYFLTVPILPSENSGFFVHIQLLLVNFFKRLKLNKTFFKLSSHLVLTVH